MTNPQGNAKPTALTTIRAVIQENHDWHKAYDDHDGYPGSDLETTNVGALAVIDAAIAAAAPPAAVIPMIRGVRVEGDTVIVSVKGGNDAARFVCGVLVESMAKAAASDWIDCRTTRPTGADRRMLVDSSWGVREARWVACFQNFQDVGTQSDEGMYAESDGEPFVVRFWREHPAPHDAPSSPAESYRCPTCGSDTPCASCEDSINGFRQ